MEQTKNRWALKVVLAAVFAFAMTLALTLGIIPGMNMTVYAEETEQTRPADGVWHDQQIDRSAIQSGDVFIADLNTIHIVNDMHTMITVGDHEEVVDWKVTIKRVSGETEKFDVTWDEGVELKVGYQYRFSGSGTFTEENLPGTIFYSGSCIARIYNGVLIVGSKTGYEASMDDHGKGNRAEWCIQPFNSMIKKVVVLDKVTWVGDYAFYNLPNLKEVEFASSVDVIGNYVFSGSGLETLTIPETVTSIGEHLFEGCSQLKSVKFPSYYKNVSSSMFVNCDSITDLSFLDGMESIGSYAFRDCDGLEDLSTLPDDITVGSFAFMNCKNLKSAKINTPTIPNGIFYGCGNLEEVEIGPDVSNIPSFSFAGCNKLERVVFVRPTYAHKVYIATLTYDFRAAYAFPDCAKVYYKGDNFMYLNAVSHKWNEGESINTAIHHGANPTPYHSRAIYWEKDYKEECDLTFEYYSGDCHVVRDEEGNLTISKRTDEGADGSGRMADYADGWDIHTRAPWGGTKIPVTNVVIEAGVTYIGNNAFSTCNLLETITIGAGVQSIGSKAFYGCGNLEEIKLPENLIDIGAYAFNNCLSLTTITFPNTVKNIGIQAFGNCRNLANAQLPETLGTIPNNMFINCEALKTITIPASVTAIGSQAFYNCAGIESVIFDASSLLTTIGGSAFYQCEALETIDLPTTLKTIGNQVFYGCVGLETLTIPALVSNIGSKAFYGCDNLKIMTFEHPEDDATLVTDQDTFINFNPEIHYSGSGNTKLYNVAIKEEVVDGGSLGSSRDGYVWRVPVQYESGDCIVDIYGFRAFISKKTNSDGSGRMADYASCEERPWNWKSDEICFVVIEEGITYIGKNTFSNLPNLNNVILPDGLKTIGEESFANNNSLGTITIPNSVTIFGDSAFADSSLSKITFIRPDMSKELSTVEVGNNAFTKGYFSYVGDSDMYLCNYRTMIVNSRLSGTTLTWRRYQYEIFTQSDNNYSIETSVDEGKNTIYAGDGETVYVKISSDTASLSQIDLIGFVRKEVTNVQDIITLIGNREIPGNVVEGEILNTTLKVANNKIILVRDGNIIDELTDDFQVSIYYYYYPDDYRVEFSKEGRVTWTFDFGSGDMLSAILVEQEFQRKGLNMEGMPSMNFNLEPLRKNYIEFTKINDGLYSFTMSDFAARIKVTQCEAHPITDIVINSNVTITSGDEQITEARKGDTVSVNIETNDNYVLTDFDVFCIKPITSLDVLVAMMGNAIFEGMFEPPMSPDAQPLDFSNLICKINDKGNFVVLNGDEVVFELTGGTVTSNVSVSNNPFTGKQVSLEVNIQCSGYNWYFSIGSDGILGLIAISNDEGDVFRGIGLGNGDYYPFEKVEITTITEGQLYTFTMPGEDVFVRVTSAFIHNIDIDAENGNINVTKDINPEKPIVANDTVVLNVESDSGYVLKEIKVYGLSGWISNIEQLVTLMGDANFTGSGDYSQLNCKVNEQGHFVIMNGNDVVVEMTEVLGVAGGFIPPLNQTNATVNTPDYTWAFVIKNDVLTSITCTRSANGEQIFSADGTGTGEMTGEVLSLTTVIEGQKYTFIMPDYDVKIVATFEENAIEPHDHNDTTLEYIAAKDATCETAGNIAYYRCTVCGELFSDANGQNAISAESVVIPAKGHDYKFDSFVWDGFTAQAKYVCSHDDSHIELHDATVTNEATTAATCEGKGIRTYTATYDGHTATKTEEIAAIGHAFTTFDSFVWDGFTAKAKYVCSHDNSHIELRDATVTSEVTTAATCTETGVTTYTATYDGHTETKIETTKALGHDWGEWIIITEPTNDEAGLERRVCSHDKTHVEERAIPVHSHNETTLELVAAKAATCTETGNIAYYVCKECGKYFADVNGQELLTAESVVTPALGHDYQAVVTAPTCTERGYTTHTCSRCGDSYVDTYVDALGHKPSEAVRENEVSATCETAGSYDEVVYCSVCKEEISRDHKTVEAFGHQYGEWAVTKAPTCTEKGVETRVCAHDKTHVETRDVDALGHNFGDWVVTKEAEVGVKGEETRTCSICGETETREIAALPYVPTTNDDGEKVYSETLTEEAKDVTELFAQAKEEEGTVEVKADELVIVFDSNAVNAIGDSDVSLSAKITTENLTVENAELVIEVTLTGATFADGSAMVSVPFAQEVPAGKVAKVYYIADDGTRTDMNATFENGKVSFVTNHFSTYAVVFEDAVVANGGLSGGAIAGIVIGSVFGALLIACAVLFLLNKKGIVKLGKKD